MKCIEFIDYMFDILAKVAVILVAYFILLMYL